MVEFELTITDPGIKDSFDIEVDWQDGTTTSYSIPADDQSTHSITIGHLYVDDDPTGTASDTQPITVRVEDDDLGTATDSVSVTVNNIPPEAIAQGPYTSMVGTPFTALAAYADEGVADTHTHNWTFTHVPTSFSFAMTGEAVKTPGRRFFQTISPVSASAALAMPRSVAMKSRPFA